VHPYILLPLLSGFAAAAIAGAILVYDRDHPAHRCAAAILGCAAYWSLLEVIWNSLDEPTFVPWLVRLSSIGWMPLGVLCLQFFLELTGDTRFGLRRWLPHLYAFTAVSIAIYIATPWGIADVVRTSWGWSFVYGPLFPFQYAPPAILASASLAVFWWRLCPRDASPGERRQGWLAFAAIAIPLTAASVTDALLPMAGVHVPRLGSASITLVGAVFAWSIHKYGYSLLAPGSFAPEILATLRDGVALIRRDGRIRSANASLARMCGQRPDALVGRPVEAFLPDVGDLGALDASMEDLECKLIGAAGAPLAVSVSSSVLRDRQREPIGYVLSVRDLREVVALRSRLVTSGRLAAVGELAAGIAHEINNPVAFVQANLHQLADHWGAFESEAKRDASASTSEAIAEVRELIEESLAGVARIVSIVQDVRGFAHAGGDPQTADVNALVEGTLRIARPQLRYRASVRCDLCPVPRVRCRPQQIQQVLLNIVLNAAAAVDEGGSIRLSSRSEGPWVVVTIEDDGCGMRPEVLERIFDPFFTTKEVGEGTGLGLSISYQIVKEHGGEIGATSTPGRGSCFTIRLPVDGGERRSCAAP
jgi:PAS domain S-box-containing protein